MLKQTLLFLLLVLFGLTAVDGKAKAKPNQPTKEQLIEIISCMGKNDCAQWPSQKVSDSKAEVVFVADGKRYTIVYTPQEIPTDAAPSINYWVRPDGTVSQEQIQTFADSGLDGFVDFGIQGGDEHKLFNREINKGAQFKPYWQDQYNAAVAKTLEFIKQHPAAKQQK